MRRKIQFIIFFSVALTLYGLLNSYIVIRGLEVLSPTPQLKTWFIGLYLFFALSFIAGRFLERVALSWISHSLVWIGSFWLAAFVYFYLFILTIDVLRLVNYIIPVFPKFITNNPVQAMQYAGIAVVALTALIIIGGHINTLKPRLRTLDLTIEKNSHNLKSLNIVVVSDIHLGTIIGKSRLEQIVAAINSLNPDLVLFPGDVFDEDIGPVIKQNLGETLRTIRSRFGVVSITGNHEYIGGVEEANRYLTDHGIRVLRDDVAKIQDSLYVVGREDRSIRQFNGKHRKPLEALMVNVDKNLPIILMDHQPFRLEEAVNNGVDLQLSGHTHHGQLWPFNFISKKVFELSWGYKKKQNTHFYVSCGVGTWGPPVRTGNRPEIVQIRLTFG